VPDLLDSTGCFESDERLTDRGLRGTNGFREFYGIIAPELVPALKNRLNDLSA